LGWKYKYPKIPHLENLRPTPRILLGRKLYWTFKEDGSNLCFWVKENVPKDEADFTILLQGKPTPCKIQISSRNLEQASKDLVSLAKSTQEYSKIAGWLRVEPWLLIYAEACRKGRSVTGVKTYDRNQLIVFDIAHKYSVDTDGNLAQAFWPYVYMYQQCYQRGIPCVGLYAETRHTSMKDLLKFRNHVLAYCKSMNWEGMVVKTYTRKYGLIQCKVKVDIPQPIVRKIKKGEPIYPPIPENEIMGAIDKVWQELGTEKFKDVKIAMPKIAKAVSEECKKHLYSSPKGKLYNYYLKYLERHLLQE